MKRMTKQRKAILDCLERATRPLSIEEIFSEVYVAVPTLNLSTLYRNLKDLMEVDDVKAHELPGHSTHYELVSSVHTHHFLCEKCKKVFNITVCPKEILSMVPKDFVMNEHYITLEGLCPDCQM